MVTLVGNAMVAVEDVFEVEPGDAGDEHRLLLGPVCEAPQPVVPGSVSPVGGVVADHGRDVADAEGGARHGSPGEFGDGPGLGRPDLEQPTAAHHVERLPDVGR